MTLVGERNVGACYKTPEGKTYTLWWLGSGQAWNIAAATWVKDQIFWGKHLRNLGVGKDRLMCIVRNV